MGLLTDDEVKKIKRQVRKIIPERVGYWAEKIGVILMGELQLDFRSSDGEAVLQMGILISIVFLF